MLILSCLLLLCALLVVGVNVPMAFGAVLLLIAAFGGHEVSGFLPAGHWKMNTVILLAIPLFILAGGIMERGKIAAPLIGVIELVVGRIRGRLERRGGPRLRGLRVHFGERGGDPDLHRLDHDAAPPRRANYPEGMVSALIVSACPLGLLIPPSASQILYAWVTQQSVLKCFLSTVIPGLILVVLLCIVNFVLLRNVRNLRLAERPERFTRELGVRSWRAFPALLMPAFILGGIYGGVMTPTEAAGVAVIYAIPVGFFIYKGTQPGELLGEHPRIVRHHRGGDGHGLHGPHREPLPHLRRHSRDSPRPSSSRLSENPIVILLMVNVVMILIGMVMDDISGLLLSAPLLLPIVTSVGMDPIHFAAVLGVNLGMANITPPTAPLLYLGSRVTGAPVNHMMKPVLIMIFFAWLPTLLVTTFVPSVALWLPDLLFS